MKKLCYLLVLIIIISTLPPLWVGAADTYEDVIDEAANVRMESVYDTELNAPFTKATSGVNCNVDPETGNMTIGYELFSLDGRAGAKSIDLQLRYTSTLSSNCVESVEYNSSKARYESVPVEKTDFEKSISLFGAGWSMYLPYVEFANGRNKSRTYVHLADGSVYRGTDSGNGLYEYEKEDVVYINDERKYMGVTARASLVYRNGDTYCFDDGGYLIFKFDRFGNTVYYKWTDDNEKMLDAVRDNCGNYVDFVYEGDNIEIICRDRRFVICRSKSQGNDGYVLESVTDPAGRKTEFTYEMYNMTFDFFGSNSASDINRYYLMTGIKYSSGLKSCFDYSVSRKWLHSNENGYIDYPKIISAYDTDSQTVQNKLTYEYGKEPTGYPDYNPSALPVSYVYSSVEKESDGKATTYVYNSKHQLVKTTVTVDGKLYSEQTVSYDSKSNMPKRSVDKTYSSAGKSIVTYTDVTFDKYGNVTSSDTYSDPIDKGKRAVNYAYNNKYSVCDYQAMLTDTDKKLEIRRSVSSMGLVTSETTYYCGKVVKTNKAGYDAYGNLSEQKIQTDKNDYVLYKIKYASDTSFKYPASVTAEHIRNADGALDIVGYGFVYDAFGNVMEQTDPLGEKTKYTYDVLGRQVSEQLPDGKVRTTKYDDYNNSVTTCDASGLKLLYSYDKYGKIQSVTNPANGDMHIYADYDAKGRTSSETDANGTRYIYDYDAHDRYTMITVKDDKDSILLQRSFDYDEAADYFGDNLFKLTVTDAELTGNRITDYWFDEFERLVHKTVHNGDETRTSDYSYDYAGNLLFEVSPGGIKTSYSYDCFGNALSVTYHDGTSESNTYDFLGNRTSFTDAEGITSYYGYDSLGRNISSTSPEGDVTRMYYDGNGNMIKETDPLGNSVDYIYNNRGFMTQSIRYAGGDKLISSYTYDPEGRVLSYSFGNTNPHTYTTVLDTYGRVIRDTDPMGFVRSYTYDLLGNVLSSTDKNGVTTTYAYDGLSRLVSRTNPSDGTTVYEYDGLGQLVSSHSNSENISYTYNAFGELLHRDNGVTKYSYEYDSDGRLTQYMINDKDSGAMNYTYTYDSKNRMTSVSTAIGKEVIAYDKAGKILTKTFSGDDTQKKYTYTPNGFVSSVVTLRDDKEVYSEKYEYDAIGNRIYSNENDRITHYYYDGMNRLYAADYDGKRVEYEFDEYNNISWKYTITDSIESESYFYDANNRLLLSDNGKDVTRYDYDNAGNMIRRSNSADVESFEYDGYNRLKGFESSDTVAVYDYDTDGIRRSKTVNGVYTRFVSDDTQSVVSEIVNGSSRNYYRGTELLGSVDADGNTFCYTSDSHGNVVSVSDVSGDTVSTYQYDAYGNPIHEKRHDTWFDAIYAKSESDPNPFGYTGEYTDAETGFIYLRARYYDPEIARFTTEDPIMDGTNWYVYCGNNPVNFVDPFGLNATATGSPYDIFTTYNEMQALTDDTLGFTLPTGHISIIKYHEGELTKPDGTTLVRDFIENPNFMLTIQRNGIDPMSGNLYGTQITAMKQKESTTININDAFNNDENQYILVDTGDGTTEFISHKDTPSFMFMGHEMIHARHVMNGNFNRKKGGYHYYWVNGVRFSETIKATGNNDEFDTVGFGYLPNLTLSDDFLIFPSIDDITENSLRLEHGLNLRVAYTTFTTMRWRLFNNVN